MTDTEGYNGWSNYPTWAVNLWLSNDEGLYLATQMNVEWAKSGAPMHANVESGIWTVEEAERFDLADQLKNWVVNDLAPDLDASFASDLLSYALGQVDWDEIAKNLLED